MGFRYIEVYRHITYIYIYIFAFVPNARAMNLDRFTKSDLPWRKRVANPPNCFFSGFPVFFPIIHGNCCPITFHVRRVASKPGPAAKTLVGDPRNRRKFVSKKNRLRRREDMGVGGIWKTSNGIGSTKIFLGVLLCIYWQLAVAWDFVCIWSYLNLPSWDCVNGEIFKIFSGCFKPQVVLILWMQKHHRPKKKIPNNFFKYPQNSRELFFFWLDIFVWQRFSLLIFFGS